MKISPSIALLVALGGQTLFGAQLEVLTNKEPQRAFGGQARDIPIVWRNPGSTTAMAEIRLRLFQTTSATAVLLTEKFWKKLEVLPAQTVLETAAVEFPRVKAETQFLLTWLESTNRVLGRTEVLIYPTNLLEDLKPLADGKPIGVFDPNDLLKPLLKGLRMEFMDLEASGLDHFSGKLAVLGPFHSPAQMREGLANEILKLAKKDIGIVWIQPPRKDKKIRPSFYSIPEDKTGLVIVQPELVSDLAESPQAQLNLIQFCRLALNPEPPLLPGLATQP
jgi:hypothetical protein